MMNKIHPVVMVAFFYEKEKIVVLPVRNKKVAGILNPGAIKFTDLKQSVPIVASLPQGIIWNIPFMIGRKQ
ncbi:hypothetical protein ACX0G9_23900 [Flavitalea flava]